MTPVVLVDTKLLIDWVNRVVFTAEPLVLDATTLIDLQPMSFAKSDPRFEPETSNISDRSDDRMVAFMLMINDDCN